MDVDLTAEERAFRESVHAWVEGGRPSSRQVGDAVRAARLFRIGPVTNEVATGMIARRLGLPRAF
jgi:hypothetical protein